MRTERCSCVHFPPHPYTNVCMHAPAFCMHAVRFVRMQSALERMQFIRHGRSWVCTNARRSEWLQSVLHRYTGLCIHVSRPACVQGRRRFTQGPSTRSWILSIPNPLQDICSRGLEPAFAFGTLCPHRGHRTRAKARDYIADPECRRKSIRDSTRFSERSSLSCVEPSL
jgi:hypothetical protein